MTDKNANHNCLVGCLSHTADGSAQSSNLDPEILSYFLVRKNIHGQDNETTSTAHQNTQDNEIVSTSRRKRHFRHRSSERSPKSPSSHKSGDSRRSQRRERHSIDSSLSALSKYPHITDWSTGVSGTSPSSFGPPQRHAVDPPRPPKPGNEWVWFPEGYWAEREIRGFKPPSHETKPKWWNRSSGQKSQVGQSQMSQSQKSQSPTKTANEDNVVDNKASSSFIPQIKIGSISLKSTTKTSRRTSRHTSNESRKSINLWRFNISKAVQEEASRPIQQREGLYCRTKRNFETRFRKRVRAWVI